MKKLWMLILLLMGCMQVACAQSAAWPLRDFSNLDNLRSVKGGLHSDVTYLSQVLEMINANGSRPLAALDQPERDFYAFLVALGARVPSERWPSLQESEFVRSGWEAIDEVDMHRRTLFDIYQVLQSDLFYNPKDATGWDSAVVSRVTTSVVVIGRAWGAAKEMAKLQGTDHKALESLLKSPSATNIRTAIQEFYRNDELLANLRTRVRQDLNWGAQELEMVRQLRIIATAEQGADLLMLAESMESFARHQEALLADRSLGMVFHPERYPRQVSRLPQPSQTHLGIMKSDWTRQAAIASNSAGFDTDEYSQTLKVRQFRFRKMLMALGLDKLPGVKLGSVAGDPQDTYPYLDRKSVETMMHGLFPLWHSAVSSSTDLGAVARVVLGKPLGRLLDWGQVVAVFPPEFVDRLQMIGVSEGVSEATAAGRIALALACAQDYISVLDGIELATVIPGPIHACRFIPISARRAASQFHFVFELEVEIMDSGGKGNLPRMFMATGLTASCVVGDSVPMRPSLEVAVQAARFALSDSAGWTSFLDILGLPATVKFVTPVYDARSGLHFRYLGREYQLGFPTSSTVPTWDAHAPLHWISQRLNEHVQAQTTQIWQSISQQYPKWINLLNQAKMVTAIKSGAGVTISESYAGLNLTWPAAEGITLNIQVDCDGRWIASLRINPDRLLMAYLPPSSDFRWGACHSLPGGQLETGLLWRDANRKWVPFAKILLDAGGIRNIQAAATSMQISDDCLLDLNDAEITLKETWHVRNARLRLGADDAQVAVDWDAKQGWSAHTVSTELNSVLMGTLRMAGAVPGGVSITAVTWQPHGVKLTFKVDPKVWGAEAATLQELLRRAYGTLSHPFPASADQVTAIVTLYRWLLQKEGRPFQIDPSLADPEQLKQALLRQLQAELERYASEMAKEIGIEGDMEALRKQAEKIKEQLRRELNAWATRTGCSISDLQILPDAHKLPSIAVFSATMRDPSIKIGGIKFSLAEGFDFSGAVMDCGAVSDALLDGWNTSIIVPHPASCRVDRGGLYVAVPLTLRIPGFESAAYDFSLELSINADHFQLKTNFDYITLVANALNSRLPIRIGNDRVALHVLGAEKKGNDHLRLRGVIDLCEVPKISLDCVLDIPMRGTGKLHFGIDPNLDAFRESVLAAVLPKLSIKLDGFLGLNPNFALSLNWLKGDVPLGIRMSGISFDLWWPGMKVHLPDIRIDLSGLHFEDFKTAGIRITLPGLELCIPPGIRLFDFSGEFRNGGIALGTKATICPKGAEEVLYLDASISLDDFSKPSVVKAIGDLILLQRWTVASTESTLDFDKGILRSKVNLGGQFDWLASITSDAVLDFPKAELGIQGNIEVFHQPIVSVGCTLGLKEGRLAAAGKFDFLGLVYGDAAFDSGKMFCHPQLQVNLGTLRLLGLFSLAEAGTTLTPEYATVYFRVCGVGGSLTLPSYETLTPELLLQYIFELLKPDLDIVKMIKELCSGNLNINFLSDYGPGGGGVSGKGGDGGPGRPNSGGNGSRAGENQNGNGNQPPGGDGSHAGGTQPPGGNVENGDGSQPEGGGKQPVNAGHLGASQALSQPMPPHAYEGTDPAKSKAYRELSQDPSLQGKYPAAAMALLDAGDYRYQVRRKADGSLVAIRSKKTGGGLSTPEELVAVQESVEGTRQFQPIGGDFYESLGAPFVAGDGFYVHLLPQAVSNQAEGAIYWFAEPPQRGQGNSGQVLTGRAPLPEPPSTKLDITHLSGMQKELLKAFALGAIQHLEAGNLDFIEWVDWSEGGSPSLLCKYRGTEEGDIFIPSTSGSGTVRVSARNIDHARDAWTDGLAQELIPKLGGRNGVYFSYTGKGLFISLKCNPLAGLPEGQELFWSGGRLTEIGRAACTEEQKPSDDHVLGGGGGNFEETKQLTDLDPEDVIVTERSGEGDFPKTWGPKGDAVRISRDDFGIFAETETGRFIARVRPFHPTKTGKALFVTDGAGLSVAKQVVWITAQPQACILFLPDQDELLWFKGGSSSNGTWTYGILPIKDIGLEGNYFAEKVADGTGSEKQQFDQLKAQAIYLFIKDLVEHDIPEDGHIPVEKGFSVKKVTTKEEDPLQFFAFAARFEGDDFWSFYATSQATGTFGRILFRNPDGEQGPAISYLLYRFILNRLHP